MRIGKRTIEEQVKKWVVGRSNNAPATRDTVWDDDLAGFGIQRMRRASSASFVLTYRVEGEWVQKRKFWSAAFSPDGTRVVTASADRTARLWDARWPSGPMPQIACALLPEVRTGRGSVALDGLAERYGITIRDPICVPPGPPFDPARIVPR